MRESRLKTCMLVAGYTDRLSYFDDWTDAFLRAHEFSVELIDIRHSLEWRRKKKSILECDLIILHHSTNSDTTRYMGRLVPLLQKRRGILMSFVGNEVNLPGARISDKRKILEKIEPDYVATQLLKEAGEYLFGDLVRKRVISVPHALNPKVFAPVIDINKRILDIGVRSVRYLPHLGDNDRNRIYDYFQENGPKMGLQVDIGEQRFCRNEWAMFLNQCKGTVSCEAGSWYLERDDHTVEKIRSWTRQRTGGILINNDSIAQRFGHMLPWSLRVFIKKLMKSGPIVHESSVASSLPFDEIYELFFRNLKKPPIYGKAVSSRHFDAIGTKTCQIMFPGRYNDILREDEHYIALLPDFSNIECVMERFRDEHWRKKLVDNAYEYVMDGHTHDHRVVKIYEEITADM